MNSFDRMYFAFVVLVHRVVHLPFACCIAVCEDNGDKWVMLNIVNICRYVQFCAVEHNTDKTVIMVGN